MHEVQRTNKKKKKNLVAADYYSNLIENRYGPTTKYNSETLRVYTLVLSLIGNLYDSH